VAGVAAGSAPGYTGAAPSAPIVSLDVMDDSGDEPGLEGRGAGANQRDGRQRGLADRVEALDGRLRVVSPVGGGTTIRAVIPCGS
jgi:signal transduction histidine kinase